VVAIVPFDPANADAARAIHELRETVRLADEPFIVPMAPQAMRGWLSQGWTTDPVVTRFVPGAEPGTVDGYYRLELPDMENQDRAGLALAVRPSRRRAGLGTELLRDAAREAAAAGRTVLDGLVLRVSGGEAFAVSAGARLGLENIRRQQDVRALPAGLLDALRATAEESAVGYSLVSWTGTVPDGRLGQVASVVNAMNDAPHDEGMEPQIWDAARVRDRWNGRFGHREYTVAAVHDATGDMAAIVHVNVHPQTPEWGSVGITAVARQHRGHRLGLLVKVAITEQLIAAEPDLRRISTMNAASNRHMIAINEMLGYEVAGPPVVFAELPVDAAWPSRPCGAGA
jgi:GNAT superfamily N-acetyltransferase